MNVNRNSLFCILGFQFPLLSAVTINTIYIEQLLWKKKLKVKRLYENCSTQTINFASFLFYYFNHRTSIESNCSVLHPALNILYKGSKTETSFHLQELNIYIYLLFCLLGLCLLMQGYCLWYQGCLLQLNSLVKDSLKFCGMVYQWGDATCQQ